MNPEQSALLQQAQDSLQAARLLAEQGFYDFAVSRAYYAMFYRGRVIVTCNIVDNCHQPET